MNDNIIAWNVTNWVTVVLMAAIGFFLVGAFLKWRQGKATASVGVVSTNQTGAQSLASA